MVGSGATDPSTAGIPADGLKLCCDVAIWQANHAQTILTNIYPLEGVAIRNANYKVVVNSFEAYDATSNSCVATSPKGFFRINENVPIPKLDTTDSNLLASGNPLNREQKKNYTRVDGAAGATVGVAACVSWRHQPRRRREQRGYRRLGIFPGAFRIF